MPAAGPPALAKTPLLLAPFFLWGTAMVAMKGTTDHTTPLFLATVRLLPAGILVLLAAAWLGRPQPQGWRAWAWIGLFGLVDGTLFQGFLAEGLTRTGAGIGSVMIDSQPLIVALLAYWLFGERIGLWGWLGLAIGIVGISLLGLPETWLLALGDRLLQGLHIPVQLVGPAIAELWPTDQSWLSALFNNGRWLMLLAALSMAVGTILSRYVSRWADPIAATGWHMIVGAIPLVLGSWSLESQQWQQLGLSDWLALSYATLFGSAIAYGLFFYFAASGSLTSLSALTFLTPVFALLFGNLFLGEKLGMIQWVGVSLSLVSILLISQRDWLTARGWKTRLQPAVIDPALPEVPDRSAQ
ncbi:DMT family transporter [Synechococcus elongatus]|nr:EamA family transporter [Synechococcus elongatus]MBD2586665.1 EamA family transporter [Synechococcus elongatus FACHB-242]MBD2687739.1 EamA family transporter [Synechococcus elongatus FACHB-1061]MBD2706551.1 EamA family transporter [Synechococcus elongatus PCC 7942 = FACHB-805]WKW04903.1 EamA family transporter [Synechococcus elongatus PCC 7942 = FACHB-805]